MTTEQMGLINEQLRFAGFNEHTEEELKRFEDVPEFELEQLTMGTVIARFIVKHLRCHYYM